MAELPTIATLDNGPACPGCTLRLDPANRHPPVWWCGLCYQYFNADLTPIQSKNKSIASKEKKEAAAAKTASTYHEPFPFNGDYPDE